MADLDRSQQIYNDDTQVLLQAIDNVVKTGSLTEEDKANINQLKIRYNESYSQVNSDIDAVRNAQNNSELNSIKNDLLGLKQNEEKIQFAVSGTVNNQETLAQLEIDVGTISSTVSSQDGRISKVEQTANGLTTTVNGFDGRITTAQQTADKYSWLIKSGTSASNMELTDRLYTLTTEKAMISAKQIELNGSVDINNGTFKVDTSGNMTATSGTFSGNVTGATIKAMNKDGDVVFNVSPSGNMKIGGLTPFTIEGYQRGRLEFTSEGTIYSVSHEDDGYYTKIKEGFIYLHDKALGTAGDTYIYSGEIVTPVICVNDVFNYDGELNLYDGLGCHVKCRSVSEGDSYTGYFHPADNGATRLGTSTYRWASVWCSQSALNTSSDRREKTDITYYEDDERYEKMFMELKPCVFQKTDSEFGRHHSGFIAQEVEDAMDNNDLDFTDFGALLKTPIDKDGEEININNKARMEECVDMRYGLRYGEFTALNTHMIQKAHKEIEELKEVVAQQQEMINQLMELVKRGE